MDKEQVQQALDMFKGYLYDEEEVELKTYPLYYDIYKKLMLPVKDNLCFSSAFVVLLAHFSRPLNFFKFYIDLKQEANQPKVPMNFYGINILKSGGGKGLTNNIVKGLLDFDYTKEKFVEGIEEDLKEGKNPTEQKELHKSIKKLQAIVGAEEQASATTAGMRKIDAMLKDVFYDLDIKQEKWIGSAFYNLQELADSLENSSSHDKDFFSTLKEMYDLGEFLAKALNDDIKGQIKQFYISFLGATTDKTLQNNPNTTKMFNNYLISGNARRSVLCFPCKSEVTIVEQQKKCTDGLSLWELYEAKKYVEDEEIIEIKKKVKNNVLRLCAMARRGQRALTISDKCHFYYSIYKYLCAERAKTEKNAILELEIENRFWKALKISGILAIYDGAFEISEDYFCEAVKIVEYYAHHFKRCLNNRVMDVTDKIVEVLICARKNKKRCGVLNTDLRSNSEVLSYNSRGLTPNDFIKKVMPDVEENLELAGYKLITAKFGYNNKIIVYGAVPNNWQNPQISEKEPYYIWDNVPKDSKGADNE